VVMALEAKLSTIPAWDVRITREKLDQLGGDILVDSSPVLMQGEKSEQVTNYAPRNFNIRCRHCQKTFHGKNALRNFELHAIFWELCKAHPSHPEQRDKDAANASDALSPSGSTAASQSATGTAADGSVTAAVARKEMTHSHVYPCNSVSRDVVVFMEAKKVRPSAEREVWKADGQWSESIVWCVLVCVQPILCNNQKKVWKLQGNLHHDTSLFQGRAWLQVGHRRRKHLSLDLTPPTYPNLPMVIFSGPYRSRRVSRGRAASWRTPRRCSASSAAGPTRRSSSTRRCVPTSSPGTTRASSPPGTAHDWPLHATKLLSNGDLISRCGMLMVMCAAARATVSIRTHAPSSDTVRPLFWSLSNIVPQKCVFRVLIYFSSLYCLCRLRPQEPREGRATGVGSGRPAPVSRRLLARLRQGTWAHMATHR
jgi:hypothetical protein